MTKLEYLKYAYEKGLLTKLKWYFSFLTVPADKLYDGDYYLYDNGKYQVKVNDTKELLEGTSEMVLSLNDELDIPAGYFPNVTKPTNTTVGILLVNYILLVKPFGDKIEYINGEVKISYIESIIAKRLTDAKDKVQDITIPEYVKFVDNSGFLTSLSRIVSISSTPKALIPPPGIDAYKKKVMQEMKDKYGDEVFQDYTRVAELETKLKEFDAEFLKDDPSFGKMLSGKVVNVARKKLFLMYGAEAGFDRSGKAKLVTNSLANGWPDDTEELARMYNASRAGSYDRGSETQKGGTAAKVVLRATNSIKIKEGDCGTKRYRTFTVNDNNKLLLVGRNITVGSNVIELTPDNIESYVNKKVKLRSPSYCKESDSNFCTTCAGPRMSRYKDGISLLVLDISSKLLDISMASMHAKELKTVKLDLDEQLS